jgi:hypothetical protein
MAMAKKKAEFPEQVFVAREFDKDTPFFVAYDNAQDHGDLDGDTRVAVYKLVEVVTVRANIEIQKD